MIEGVNRDRIKQSQSMRQYHIVKAHYIQSQISHMNPTELIKHRSSLLIFRDCLKLASQMVTNDPVKVRAIRKLLKDEFVKNRDVQDEEMVQSLKMNAVRGISNYIIYTVKKQYTAENQKTIYDKEDEENSDVQHTR